MKKEAVLFLIIAAVVGLGVLLSSDFSEDSPITGSVSGGLSIEIGPPLLLLTGWDDITPPEGVFEPASALVGTHINDFSIRFVNLSLSSGQVLGCDIKTANGSIRTVNQTGVTVNQGNFSLNYTVLSSDSIINDSGAGYIPWVLKNCSILSGGSILFNESVTSRIYTHSSVFWADSEVTRAVACAGSSGVYFNNTAKCEFLEDTLFALQLRNGNPVNEACFNNPGVACADDLCNGIYFPTCDPLDFFAGFSADSDDPNNVVFFSVDFAGFSTEVQHTGSTNTSGTFKLRVVQGLTSQPFSITVSNLTNVSGASVYGAETGSGTTSVTDQGDGTFSVAYNRFSDFTGMLDFTFNVSFDAELEESRILQLVIAYGTSTNQGTPELFPSNFSSIFGLRNNNESENTSITTDIGGVCGDEANNDFDYIGGTFANSFDCFDPDCDGFQGDESQTNEFGSGKTGLCSFAAETNCTDGFDNDYDFQTGGDFTDCHDADCFHINLAACPLSELVCNDSINNDWDYTVGEADSSSHAKIDNNGIKYSSTLQADIIDCEDIDCNGSIGGSSGELCNYGSETNCSDGFDNDALQLIDCNLLSVDSSTATVTPAFGEYDCSVFCRATNDSVENGTQCDDNIDNDWDAIVLTGVYTDQFSSNGGFGAGTDCRWGGYGGIGSNFNPDEDCNLETLSSGFRCELQFELNCTDEFDNDFDSDASGMPSAGWSADSFGYASFFGLTFLADADFDDYDCASDALAPANESLNASWCFDGIDNDIDAYFWNGTTYEQNGSTGPDCFDPDCLGVVNPANVNQSCLTVEFNASDPFFSNRSFPGLFCANSFDDDVDGDIDCSDSDCFKQFDMCSQGPCYDSENITWNSCLDSADNDFADGTDCSDSDCVGLLGSSSGAFCESVESVCFDGFDNDDDGSDDCSDLDCAGSVGSSIDGVSVLCSSSESGTGVCFDGFDNDDDGDIDCLDSGCSGVCGLSSISGSSPLTLPTQSGAISLNSVSTASIQDSTKRVRRGEIYNIIFKMTGSSGDVQWTIGTASGGVFDKTKFDVSSAVLGGPDSGSFGLTETANGFIVDSNGASLPSGYVVSFLINSTSVLSSTTYEVTYAEATGFQISLNNDITYEIVEDNAPSADALEIVPNSTKLEFGDAVFLRANISDDTGLGLCDWAVGGPASFDPSDSTICEGSFLPTIEGSYTINVTPVDFYNNVGSVLSVDYDLNIMPSASSITTDKRFYAPSESSSVNGTFNVVSTDSLGSCSIIARDSGGAESVLSSFSASGPSCVGSVSLSSLGDDVYSIFARVTETTEGNVVDGVSNAIFVCSQVTSGACAFADFDLNGTADVCELVAPPTPGIIPTPSAGPGGAGGDAAAAARAERPSPEIGVFIITEPELIVGKTLDITDQDLIILKTVSFGDHEVKVVDVRASGITMDISDESVEFDIGDEVFIDLDEDGNEDIVVTFEGFFDGKIRLTFVRIFVFEKGRPGFGLLILLAIIALIIVVLTVTYLRIVKSQARKLEDLKRFKSDVQ